MLALDDRDLGEGTRLLEPPVLEDLVRPRRRADGVVIALVDRLRADSRADDDCDDDEGEPAEDRQFAMARGSVAHAGREMASGVAGWMLHGISSVAVSLEHGVTISAA